MSYLKPQPIFSLNFTSLFNVMEDKSSVLLQLTLYMIFTKGAHHSAKFHQICTLIGYFPWKYTKFQLNKVWRKYASWYERVVQNLKKNLFFVSKMTKIWWILIRALKSLKNFNFDWSLLYKVYNVWPKKVQRSYISWNWRVMQNLKKNWLVVWKMTWGIWQSFIRTLESVKIGIFMWSFCPR